MSDKDIQLSRRKVLAGLGTIGVASAGAGLGTTAWLSDEESFLNNAFTAGTLDLIVDYSYVVDQDGVGPSDGSGSGVNNGGEGQEAGGDPISFTIDDVKPGDSGHFQFCFEIHDNPAYLWTCGTLTESAENGYTEPEPEDDNGEGELDDAIQATAYYCDADGNQIGNQNIASGSIGEVVEGLTYGLPLDGDPTTPERDPFAPGIETENPCVCIDWNVPTAVGNEIQGDSLSFDVVFHAVQSRHNDGSANPCCDCGEGEYAVTLNGQTACLTPWTEQQYQEGDASVDAFYAYNDPGSSDSVNVPLQEDTTSSLGLYEDGNGDLHLIVVHESHDSADGGAATFTFAGLGGASVVVPDDPPNGDTYSGGVADWAWTVNHTDGGAFGPLDPTFDVQIDMAFNDAANRNPLDGSGTLDEVRFVNGDGSEALSAPVATDGDGANATARVSHTCVALDAGDDQQQV